MTTSRAQPGSGWYPTPSPRCSSLCSGDHHMTITLAPINLLWTTIKLSLPLSPSFPPSFLRPFSLSSSLPLSLPRSLPSSFIPSPFLNPSLPPSLPPRHRLREGFHIAHAQSGVVTLTAQLSVSQPHSTNHLAMILQYVVFPLTANPSASASFVISGGYPTCELWVEPQYGTVTQAPAGLQYLLGSTHTQIADKVCGASACDLSRHITNILVGCLYNLL